MGGTSSRGASIYTMDDLSSVCIRYPRPILHTRKIDEVAVENLSSTLRQVLENQSNPFLGFTGGCPHIVIRIPLHHRICPHDAFRSHSYLLSARILVISKSTQRLHIFRSLSAIILMGHQSKGGSRFTLEEIQKFNIGGFWDVEETSAGSKKMNLSKNPTPYAVVANALLLLENTGRAVISL